ncbi:MAG: thiamine pyrophosphate-dependent enzyme [Elusimicrobiota bacterium]|jgi:2-oxoisovalerate dehydrogenase E1 component
MTGKDLPAELSELYRKAFLIREAELRLLELFTQGKVNGTIHTCVGQEFTGLAVASALQDGDLVFSNHRGHGHFIAVTSDLDGLVAEVTGKASGVCKGRGGSQHLHKDGFYSNGVQGGTAPVAAGMALALKLKGSKSIAVAFIGDGTLGEGAVYEALNIAAKWSLPLLVVVENNLYSQSTPQAQTLAGGILERAAAFNIPASSSTTADPAGLAKAACEAVEAVRSSRAPRLLKVDTYRLKAHSKGDDDRDPAEVRQAWDRDPLSLFSKSDSRKASEFAKKANEAVEASVAKAAAAADPAPAPARVEPVRRSRAWKPLDLSSDKTLVSLINEALARNMARDPRLVLLGEDLADPYGGAFKATKGLSTRFPGRVFNTPISESAIVGLSNGLALQGYLPVAEIMFGDFLTLAADQIINHASKFRYMYGDSVKVPLVIRTPMGGRRGYGATHSQCLEKHFLGVPDTELMALHARLDPGPFYDALLQGLDKPVIVIEDKLLYGSRLSKPVPAGFVWEADDSPVPTTRLRPAAAPDLTILAYGGMVPFAEAAAERLFDEHDLAAEVIAPVRLYPFDPGPLVESVSGSRRLLTAEEGVGFAGFGAEAASQLAELGVTDFQLKRLACSPHPVPSAASLEKVALPGTDHIVSACLEFHYGE